MAKFPFTLAADEQIIDTWTLLYLPEKGSAKYNGKLTITNKRLLYDAKYDVSLKGLLSEAMFVKWGSEGYLEILKSDIAEVRVEKSFLSKKAILLLVDGTFHTFSYGAMNIDKVVDAMNAR